MRASRCMSSRVRADLFLPARRRLPSDGYSPGGIINRYIIDIKARAIVAAPRTLNNVWVYFDVSSVW